MQVDQFKGDDGLQEGQFKGMIDCRRINSRGMVG